MGPDGLLASPASRHPGPHSYKKLLGLLLGEAAANSRELFQFKPFHRSIREPQDYQSFGEQFFDIVLVKETSG